jgi:hypothetical protein
MKQKEKFTDEMGIFILYMFFLVFYVPSIWYSGKEKKK